ncbi:TPA: hypothetical protein ACQ431_003022 [Citrobacter murliniae]
MQYYYSASTIGFYLSELNPVMPNDAVEIDEDTWRQYLATPPEGKVLGSDEEGKPAFVDKPVQPNSELLKAALTSLSTKYQDDIEVLNRAWLAAAVNDGVNETTKKDAVVVQITARKSQYASDRAAVIAQYPV